MNALYLLARHLLHSLANASLQAECERLQRELDCARVIDKARARTIEAARKRGKATVWS